MKKTLTKLLFISLLFSAAVPAAAQASFFSWTTLRSGAAEVGSKTVNWLTTNGGKTFNFLKEHPIAAVTGIVCTWELSKMIQKKTKQQPFLNAVGKGDVTEATQYLESGTDVNMKDSQSWTPLIIAVSNNDFKMVKLLLANKANVNMQNKNGYTALILAVRENNPEIIKLLIENGAIFNAQDIFTTLTKVIVSLKAAAAGIKEGAFFGTLIGATMGVTMGTIMGVLGTYQLATILPHETIIFAYAWAVKVGIEVGIKVGAVTGILMGVKIATERKWKSLKESQEKLSNNTVIKEFMRQKVSSILNNEEFSPLPRDLTKLTAEFTY